MAVIKQAIQAVGAKLATLNVVNGDNQTVPLHTRLFNNQTRFRREGKSYEYPVPAAFVEVINNPNYGLIGEGVRAADVSFRIHLEHHFYHDDGNFDQDLRVYDLRDAVVGLLQFFQPPGCGPLAALVEEADYDHDNINEYIIDFVCNFIDTAGQKQYIEKTIAEENLHITTTFKINPVEE